VAIRKNLPGQEGRERLVYQSTPSWIADPTGRTDVGAGRLGLVRYGKALDLREATTSMDSSNYANPSQPPPVVVLLVPRGLKADTPTSWVNAI